MYTVLAHVRGLKVWLETHIPLSHDSLHIHGSLLILFASALILRRRADDRLCWLAVLACELVNETSDMLFHARGENTLAASLHDLINTMIWPTAILLLGRRLFPPRARARPAA